MFSNEIADVNLADRHYYDWGMAKSLYRQASKSHSLAKSCLEQWSQHSAGESNVPPDPLSNAIEPKCPGNSSVGQEPSLRIDRKQKMMVAVHQSGSKTLSWETDKMSFWKNSKTFCPRFTVKTSCILCRTRHNLFCRVCFAHSTSR